MENKLRDIIDYINNNDIDCDSYMIDVLKEMDLNDSSTLEKALAIRKRYDENNSKYPEKIMCQLRQRLGLDDKYDQSMDDVIEKMNKNEVFENLLRWNGIIGWEGTIKEWVNVVYDVKLDEN